ncbi:hypothetical protein GGR95_003795 [Sulfitobacter undariae]|uniref:Uncharacterized protein n=1 Tax=Sulfitobacter undariae TaxID=1563671 RepID=A0A7W6E7F7_9RHOB|nr:hypothetical protein [Sulfitobacter undariae]
MAVSELIALATSVPSILFLDAYFWVAARLGHPHYIFAWLKLHAGLGGQLRD